MDKREHDKVSSASEASANDEEYELDVPDPNVLSAEDRHAKQVAESAKDSIDLDDIYREAERQRGGEILEQWVRNFRFQVEHVFIATAFLAIALSLYEFGLLRHTLIIVFMLFIVGLYGYVRWQERKHEAEAARMRNELYARRRERLARPDIGKSRSEPVRIIQTVPQPAPLPDAADEISREPIAREPYRISQRSVIIAMTTAAAIFGIIRLFGAAATATIVGLVALAGLIVHALGFQPPQPVILGWWFILMLYVLLSI